MTFAKCDLITAMPACIGRRHLQAAVPARYANIHTVRTSCHCSVPCRSSMQKDFSNLEKLVYLCGNRRQLVYIMRVEHVFLLIVCVTVTGILCL